jgi:geranylgeranyl diphosphate synthase type II
MNFDFDHYSSQVRAKVEAYVDSRLVPAQPQFSTRLIDAMRYSFFAGGKRIRPLLVFAAADAVRNTNGTPAPPAEPLPETLVASAVECIHTYSLIHDDLPAMDDDDLRRGKPTCHKQFDEATAILAGDALLNLGFQILIEAAAIHGTPMLRAARDVGDATGIGGMVTGQMLDLLSVQLEPTPERVRSIHTHKTGALLRACVLAGGHVGEATIEQEAALSTFGESVGLAFQIVDDLLDLEKTTEQLGKRAGKDDEQNKMTYPAAFGVDESHRMAEELTAKAYASLEPFGEAATALRTLANLLLCRDH